MKKGDERRQGNWRRSGKGEMGRRKEEKEKGIEGCGIREE